MQGQVVHGQAHTGDEFGKAPDYYGEVTTGTTLVAVMYDKGVMVAADCRTSMGSMIADRSARKLYQLTESSVLMAAGNAAHNQVVARMVRNHMSQFEIELGDAPQIKSVSYILSKILYNNKASLQSSMILGGWDRQTGGQIFAIPMGGSLIPREKFASAGSGQVFLAGYLDNNFKYNMTYEEAKDLLIRAVSQAIRRDNSSGGSIRLSAINEHGVQEEYHSYNDIHHYDHAKN